MTGSEIFHLYACFVFSVFISKVLVVMCDKIVLSVFSNVWTGQLDIFRLCEIFVNESSLPIVFIRYSSLRCQLSFAGGIGMSQC